MQIRAQGIGTEVLFPHARKAVLKSVSPALEKQREKRRVVVIKTLGTAMEAWLANARLADSTRVMRKHIRAGRDSLQDSVNQVGQELPGASSTSSPR